MRKRSGKSAVPEVKSGAESDFAWRVHDALGDWTARVDTKASIALAIEAAAAGFVVTLATNDGVLAQTSGWAAWLLGLGVGSLVLGVIAAIAVVFPQLRGRKTKAESKDNFVYFGHLRHWMPEALEKRLADEAVGLAQLSTQIVNMSKIAWYKHRWLQWSLGLFLASVLLVGAALVTQLNGSEGADTSQARAAMAPATSSATNGGRP